MCLEIRVPMKKWSLRNHKKKKQVKEENTINIIVIKLCSTAIKFKNKIIINIQSNKNLIISSCWLKKKLISLCHSV